MKTKRITLLLAIIAFCAFSLALSFSVVNKTRAEEVTAAEGIVMTEGASVRYDAEEPGIRFTTEMTKSYYDELVAAATDGKVDFYTIITVNGNTEKSARINHERTLRFENGVATFQAAQLIKLVNRELTAEERKKAAAFEFTADFYAEYINAKGETVTVKADKSGVTRSMRGVASYALLNGNVTDENKINMLKGYLGTVTENTEVRYADLSDKSKVDLGLESGAVYLTAQKAGDITDGVVDLSAENIKTGVETTVSVFDADNNVTRYKYIFADKIITKAEDLAVFAIADHKTYKNEGYYILGNDIDATGYTHKHGAWLGWGENQPGFEGTFDGRGYTINNLSIGAFGLFGYIRPHTVLKNFALVNMKPVLSRSDGVDAFGGLAYIAYSTPTAYPTLENIYLSSSFFLDDYVITSGKTQGKTQTIISSMVFSATWGYEQIKNCIFEYTGDVATGGRGIYSGLLQGGKDKITVLDSFVIGKNPVVQTKSNDVYDSANNITEGSGATVYPLTRYSDYAGLTANVTDFSSFDTAYWDISNGAPVFKGAQKYLSKPYVTIGGNTAANYELGINDVKTLGVTAFIGELNDVTYTVTSGSEYVTVSDGNITGVAVGDAVITAQYTLGGEVMTSSINVTVVPTIIEVTTPLEFSMADGTLTAADKIAIFGNSDIEILSVNCFDASVALSIADGVITGFPEYTAKSTPKTYAVSFTTAEAIYKVNVTPYTKIIRTAADLSVFNFPGHDGYKNEGYYVLGNNIDASGYLHKHTTAAGNPTYIDWNTKGTTGFEGTIDGRGYTISNITIGTGGLLGYIRPKTVLKNFAITGITFQRTHGNGDPLTAALAKIMYSTKDSYPILENLYIQANAFIGGADTNSNLVVNCTTGYEKIVNCIFEYSGVKDTTAGHGTYASQIADRNVTGFKIENSYVISLNPVACGGKTNPVYDSANKIEATTAEYTALYPDGSTFPKKDFYTVELTRYDDYTELTANVTDFSSFSADYWDISAAGYPVWKTK
ncbi:MAG TPA: hypothetical protein DEV87_05875 [Clostridiales bacterium]|nr:hypothetical protein [Clostridiales bacterium]